jgi:formate hydrogenlyase maturation protein HycH
MAETAIEFYRLNQKFVDNRESTPSRSENLIYHTMALGHHIGVLDCFQQVISVPENIYRCIVSKISRDECRKKLEGVLKWGEIEITPLHSGTLLQGITAAQDLMTQEEKDAAKQICDNLLLIEKEPTIYMVVRRK